MGELGYHLFQTTAEDSGALLVASGFGLGVRV